MLPLERLSFCLLFLLQARQRGVLLGRAAERVLRGQAALLEDHTSHPRTGAPPR
jgi:hypothetical protein